MAKNKVNITVNNTWNNSNPLVTVITPVFNRRKELKRAISSVKAQTFKNFEYIIVDDGSTDAVDDIVSKLMSEEIFPVMFIKKTNGGVHTARNIAIKKARGKYLVCLDSDDEILPTSIDTFISTWNSINPSDRENYWQIRSRYKDADGHPISPDFPENINQLPKNLQIKAIGSYDYAYMCITSLMKKNPWPEPEGITLAAEGIVLNKLNKEYKTYYINDITGVYHTETAISYSNGHRGKKTKQICRNIMWNSWYILKYNHTAKFKTIFQYCLYRNILKVTGDSIVKRCKYSSLLTFVLYAPAKILSFYYLKHKMIEEI